jgi:hypothetical protein
VYGSETRWERGGEQLERRWGRERVRVAIAQRRKVSSFESEVLVPGRCSLFRWLFESGTWRLSSLKVDPCLPAAEDRENLTQQERLNTRLEKRNIFIAHCNQHSIHTYNKSS